DVQANRADARRAYRRAAAICSPLVRFLIFHGNGFLVPAETRILIELTDPPATNRVAAYLQA
ncbi:MAG TPA: hypothetical protein VIR01_03595, partial [Pyrinomonadaceae bacterium]